MRFKFYIITIIFIALSSVVNSQDVCGKSKLDNKNNTVDGRIITPNSFPWIATLLSTNDKYMCGGTLISNQKVLTAAHCIQEKDSTSRLNAKDILVLLGSHNLRKTFEPGRLTVELKQINIHPEWNPYSLKYHADIAVLVLKEALHFTENVRPICVKPPFTVERINKGVVVGYRTSGDDQISSELVPKLENIPIVDDGQCLREFPKIAVISSLMSFCGGYANGSGVCHEDNGNGLFVYDLNRYYLRGIVSASLRGQTYGCDFDTYTIFTDVLKYKDWIENVDNEGNFYDLREQVEQRIALVFTPEKSFGGTLVSNDKVVTAAKNVIQKRTGFLYDPTTIQVVLGVHNWNNPKEKGRVSVQVSEIQIHPDYKSNDVSSDADIAILLLSKKVELNSYIQPIKLIEPNSHASRITSGIVPSFGRANATRNVNIAEFMRIPIQSNQICWKGNYAQQKRLCGGKEKGNDICEIDIGSGWIVTDGKDLYLRGVATSSVNGALFECRSYGYKVFTDVSKFTSWIRNAAITTTTSEPSTTTTELTTTSVSSTTIEELLTSTKTEPSTSTSTEPSTSTTSKLVTFINTEPSTITSTEPTTTTLKLLTTLESVISTTSEHLLTTTEQATTTSTEPQIISKITQLQSATTETILPPEEINAFDEDILKNISYHKNFNLLNSKKCGFSKYARVAVGENAKFLSHPWIARLGYLSNNQIYYNCGGTLISKYYVLTAAHCVTKLQSNLQLKQVRLGEYDTSNEIDCEDYEAEDENDRNCADPLQDIEIEKSIPHPHFKINRDGGHITAIDNDIALIRLKTAAKVKQNNIKTVCLPVEKDTTDSENYFIIGWGLTENPNKTIILQEGSLSKLSLADCQNKIRTIGSFSQIQLDDRTLCAGGDTKTDACKGDSGGPLLAPSYINNKRKTTQFGIISYGIKSCGEKEFPGIYVNVHKYLKWILDNMY